MKSATLPIETGDAPVVKHVSLVQQEPASAVVQSPDDWVLMFERLATNPQVDVVKLEKLIDMRERLLKADAKTQFDAAFADMQGELPVITEHGAIEVGGVVRSKYARFEDIIEAVRPVLQRHGFSIRHRNLALPDNKLKIVGILSHRGGHSEEDEFECPPDTSGSKAGIQSFGSTRSYGQRYTTISLLCIVTRGQDDDGKKAGKKPEPDAPAGFDDWLDNLTAAADEGYEKFKETWNPDSVIPFRNHLARTKPGHAEKLRLKSKEVK